MIDLPARRLKVALQQAGQGTALLLGNLQLTLAGLQQIERNPAQQRKKTEHDKHGARTPRLVACHY
ncbi:hypothetical protein SDC9_195548 [bioreactor metagenome]|uniref:Uncharacterized protein n=1 Tax=bioreactor metagenome TaxID=1076179 RepID=A0A645II05_9ZZZZ